MSAIEILSVASEVFPLVGSGSVANMVGSLPAALAHEGVVARTLVPGYPAVLAALDEAEAIHEFAELFGAPARLLSAAAGDLELLVLEAPHLYQRPGDPYVDADGADWHDNAVRFAALCRVAADLALGALERYRPDLVHCHDWQAGLTPAYLTYGARRRPPTVTTVHDPAFQGLFPASLLDRLGLPLNSFGVDGVEFHGSIGFLKAGLRLADRITTISPTDASEIRTPERGAGLDGLLRSRAHDTIGILDGIDTGRWNPATDAFLVQPFNSARLGGRPENKRALQARGGLDDDPESLLLAVVSRRLAGPGEDILLDALPAVIGVGAQVVIRGSREGRIEESWRAAGLANPGRVACIFGDDENLVHQIFGGADALVVPSRADPGATALRALRYGAVPLVAKAGGLADSVIDANEAAVAAGVATGVQFAPVTQTGLEAAIRRLAALFAEPEVWQTMQRNGMKADVSWRTPARRYAALYRELIATRAT